MDKTPMEFSSYVGPDTLRKVTHLLKNLYDMHTKRYCGYEDMDGSQYVGTTENFGSELLLEARKILLDKPSLKNIFIENTFDFYFDIQYSEIIDTYDQQSMLCAVLRKDVLLSNREYRIRFDNAHIVNIPRSFSSSDPLVYRDCYLETSTPPVLVISGGEEVEEVNLILSDESSVNTKYYFHLGHDTSDMYSEIDENGTLITNPITDSMNGRPFVWMCVDVFRLLPDIGFYNNMTLNDVPFLTLGTNGHHKSLIYPALNFPTDISPDNWLIKVIPDDDEGFFETKTSQVNYSSRIKEIHLMEYDATPNPGIKPIRDIVITYDDTYTKITLNNEMVDWDFKKPVVNDYDYDGRTYHNLCYAYTPLKSFNDNLDMSTSDTPLIPGFTVNFGDEYLHEYEKSCLNSVAGIHVDVTSDHSDHSVSKKNGVIHNLGDFDGLPPYFKYMIDDVIHRAHVEIYAIRDKLNDVNRTPTDKQTSAIIVDSGIPQNEIQKITDDMSIDIAYDLSRPGSHLYETIHEPISKTNSLSEITFSDRNLFGNSRMAKHRFEPKFVYHGHRNFSLGKVTLDPILEMGRVYIISNDSAAYKNNDTTKHKKAPRTFARICDIPTEFSQLVNIKDVAPTLVIDTSYVRTQSSFTTDDKNVLYNLTNKEHFMSWNNMIVFNPQFEMNALSTVTSKKFPKYIKLNEMINLNSSVDIAYDVGSGGTGYEIGDEFLFYIGGICIRGIVKEAEEGVVTKVVYINSIDNEIVETDAPDVSYGKISRGNFKARNNVYSTERVTGNGTGLCIIATISENTWDNTEMKTDGILDNIFALKQDYFGNIWVWMFDDNGWKQSIQISGDKVYDNPCDTSASKFHRSLRDTFINNTIVPISNQITDIVNDIRYVLSKLPISYNIFDSTDFSSYINESFHNVQNGLFFFDEGYVTSNYHNLVVYEYSHVIGPQEDISLPAYHDLNLSDYVNKTNKLRFMNNGDSQPTLYVFNPMINTIDGLTTVHRDMMIKTSSRPMLITDVITKKENIPDIIDSHGMLSRNLYYFDEFDMDDIDNMRLQLEMRQRSGLIEIIQSQFPNSNILRLEGTDYQYSKQMLIDYIITNTLTHDRIGINENAPETIYRRPDVKLIHHVGDRVFDNFGDPIGKQPTGAFQPVTTEIRESNVKLDTRKSNAEPLFIFKLDGDVDSLKGFRMLDDLDNDISNMTLLIVNNEMYVSIEDKVNGIDWVKIER